MVDDPRGNLVEASIQLLFILLDYIPPADIARTLQLREQTAAASGDASEGGAPQARVTGDPRTVGRSEPGMGNLFCSFISRLHQNDVCKRGFWMTEITYLYQLQLCSGCLHACRA